MGKLGKVYLIGAGPGDKDLLTIKGKHCLKMADVIIYDNLANPALLSYASKNAQCIYAGKKSGCHTIPQEGINALLVKYALAGKVVARLKGGDPLVFGRGGEEALRLKEKAIPFEFVPGISSVIGVPCYAGIPLTHRNVANSFAVLTGHEAKRLSSKKWKILAESIDTLVFLMSFENIETIIKILLSFGKDPLIPAAVICKGTTNKQKTVVSTLCQIVKRVKEERLESPSLLIIGHVVSLRSDLQWFENKPLFGKNVLVTRGKKQSQKLSTALSSLGANVLEAPTITIEPLASLKALDTTIKNLEKYKWLIFTSANAIEIFFTRLSYLGKDARSLAPLKVAVIGKATGDCLKEHGINYDFMPSTYTESSLLKELLPHLALEDYILLPQGKVNSQILEDGLKGKNHKVHSIAIYETLPSDYAAESLEKCFRENRIDFITFTSSSTVTNFMKLLGRKKSLIKNSKIIAIGPTTYKTCLNYKLHKTLVASEASIKGMCKTILQS